MEKMEVVKSGKYYVYQHRRGDNGKVFYVGAGHGRRAWDKTSRNPHWHNVVNKHGYEVEIVEMFDDKEDAFGKEKTLIAEIGLDNLVNICEGGEGGPGYEGEESPNFLGYTFIFSDEHKLVVVADGKNGIDAAGFNHPHAYAMKNHQKYDYITSKKIHKNGMKIKFNRVVQSNDDDYFQEVLASGYLFIEEFGEEISGQQGENCPNFKGYSIGFNQNQIVILCGKEMTENGFNPSNITKVISGKAKSHKKFKWYRVQSFDEIPQEHRILEPFNDLTKQRLETLE